MKNMDKINEKLLKEALVKGTDEATALKERVWTNIEKELDFKEDKNLKKKRPIFKYAGVAAALAIVVFATNTSYVNAAVDKIKGMFAPTKTIEQSLEGNIEKTEMDLEVSSQKYVIYVDKSIYELIKEEGKDIIKPKGILENLPEVSMTIEQVAKKPSEAAIDIEKELQNKFPVVKNLGEVSRPLKALALHGIEGHKGDSTVVDYYIVDNEKGGSFIIKKQYFLEAAEGHGVRFDNMLKEFKIINE
jgi:hypothetical protein